MDYPSVAAVKPDIIYMSAQGLGPGPYETYLTYGPNLQSFGGMTSIWAHPDDPYPVGSTISFPDNQAGKQGLAAVLAALMRREATGEGCYLDCAQFEVCLWSIADKFLQHQIRPGSVTVQGNRSADYAPHGCYPCAGDDQWCAVAADNDAEWARLATLLGDERWQGEKWATVEARLERSEELDEAMAAWTRDQTPAEAVARLRAAGVSASIVVDGKSQAHDADLHESGFYTAVAHPRAGVRYYTGLPILLDGERMPVRRAPIIGEHTEHVMFDLLDVPAKELSHLVAGKFVGT
jgi:benzylsuccinate CoA-transferase BbsF subunit